MTLPLIFQAEDGWMEIRVSEVLDGKLELALRGMQGVRGSRWEQLVDLDAKQRIQLAGALLEGTDQRLVKRGGRS